MTQVDRHKNVTQALVALGGNMPTDVGSPDATLSAAIDAVTQEITETGRVMSVSPFYETPCFPVGEGPDYINAVMMLAVAGGALDLLALLHGIEEKFGRARGQRWGQRTLDLDLLDFGGKIFPDCATYSFWRDLPREQQGQRAPEGLILPHPRLQDRGFVLVPLRDVAPDWHHPVSGDTAGQMLDRLDPAEIAEIRPLGAPSCDGRVVKGLSRL